MQTVPYIFIHANIKSTLFPAQYEKPEINDDHNHENQLIFPCVTFVGACRTKMAAARGNEKQKILLVRVTLRRHSIPV